MLLIASFSANDITQLKRNNNQMQGLYKKPIQTVGKWEETLQLFKNQLKTGSIKYF